MQSLPAVKIPSGLAQTSSGLSLVTSLEDASSILSSDQTFTQSRYATDKVNSNTPRASSDSADDASQRSDSETSSSDAVESAAGSGPMGFDNEPSLPPRTVPDVLGSMDSTGMVPRNPNDGIIRDWKGDPMIVNPGDKLPMKFL